MDISINLIRRCKKKDREAFDLLFSRCEKQLFRLCCSYARDKNIALDIMQEVYIKVFRSIDSFDESRTFQPWLNKIAVNTCINYNRDHNKQQLLSLDIMDGENQTLLESLSSSYSLEKEVINRSIKEMIALGINELPDAYRLALILRYLEDMNYKTIADMLELPLGTVKSNIARGREMLKKRLHCAGLLEV
ncbi:MAG: sigma-70 family RNA polymerase sigma factor [Syntrophomonadaceae bacterium]|nr:sigma-70 family RNA polymerase sigma factor [Syntrophomonadaceae bacterium]